MTRIQFYYFGFVTRSFIKMWIFFALGVLASFSSALGACTGTCEQPTLLYDSLKCTPVYGSTDDCCPSKYDCSNIEEKGISDDKCYFEGRAYSSGESVNNDDTYANCRVGCTCRSKTPENKQDNANFVCAILDCPEWLGYHPEFGCHLKYEAGKCCSRGQVCNSTTTCEVNGKTVHLGMKFENPIEKCTECVCGEGFTGEFIEPFCKKRKCVEEIGKQKEVYSFCAPSYISTGDCCPYSWICPEESDHIETAVTPSENKCKFGSALFNIGDKFSRTKGKGEVTCECRIPPYLTCIQNYDYPTW